MNEAKEVQNEQKREDLGKESTFKKNDLGARAKRLSAIIGRRRFGLLLGALIALLVFAPLFDEAARGQNELGFLFSLLVFGFVIAAQRMRFFAISLALLWLVLTWGLGNSLVSDLVFLGLCAVTIYSLMWFVFSSRQVTLEVLAAAISVYILIGIIWAVLYTLLESHSPGSLHISSGSNEDPWNALLYFSFATLTTLGYGDIAPLSLTARAWASLEAMCGTLFLAILLARLVSLFGVANNNT